MMMMMMMMMMTSEGHSHVHCKSGNISETVQGRDVISTYHIAKIQPRNLCHGAQMANF